MKMQPDDYIIQSVSSTGVMKVVARFSGMSLEWPTVISDPKNPNTRYKFQSNESMESWMIGNYSGHAKYLLVE